MADQDTFGFLDLPPELRNKIYYLALGEYETSSDPYGPTTCTALAPPALTRTNRQIRKETLGLYYSQNRFSFKLPFPGGPDAFERWCTMMGPHLQLVTRGITFMHDGNVSPRHYPAMTFGYKIGFELCSDRAEDDPRRVGNETLDVNSPYDVSLACYNTMLSQAGPHFWLVGRKAAFDKVVEALCAVAPLCSQVNSRIYMVWRLPFISRQALVALT
ncbi:hypothetical protein PG985_011760 [Apiospora marii]|uniref:uncharacterized protein n=1 Tax=Apiospora marii TaxID=335849 RepID=UPI00312DFF97